jgi:hypothetical protein
VLSLIFLAAFELFLCAFCGQGFRFTSPKTQNDNRKERKQIRKERQENQIEPLPGKRVPRQTAGRAKLQHCRNLARMRIYWHLTL